MASTSAETSHPVVFTTQTAYPLPTQKFMIPTSWKRYQLSQLVNKALSLPKPIPFDFLVRGEILRGTLAEWCTEKGIGEEETLDIEYFESVMPPQKMSSLPHEDWVSSVSCQLLGYFFTASYDGNVRAFDYSQKLLHSAAIHSAPVTSICLVPSSSSSSEHLVASASHDLTARLTTLTLPSDSSQPVQSQTVASLHLHTAPLASISANSSGSHLLTASWDGLIGVWDTSTPTSDEVPADEPTERKKRRRVEEDTPRPKRKAPLSVLKSHTARVSKAVFGQESAAEHAYSCGFDSTVRVWDVENGVCMNTIAASSKPFLDLALTPSGSSALVCSTDRTVSQYDFRAAETNITASTASLIHPATPACIAVPPAGAEHQLLTGAYDGVVRLWDLRSTKSAVTSFRSWDGTEKKGKKVLSVDWARGVVGVGGEGGVEIWRVGEGEGDRVLPS
ncbi:ribosome biogenesis protein YTM1 [Daedalea quercina L-15889]|uniref:Ribosome biogenesis protein YTM1 n=1 Tax=Daedalea quercina L-15889 TaxID=1314783 RepID=A0A165KMH4_9APHY|nr:ribosome biogenesis protein YTM1 [Daedalea quercina L-15889]